MFQMFLLQLKGERSAVLAILLVMARPYPVLVV